MMYHSQAAQAATPPQAYRQMPQVARRAAKAVVRSRREETARHGRDLLTSAERQICDRATD